MYWNTWKERRALKRGQWCNNPFAICLLCPGHGDEVLPTSSGRGIDNHSPRFRFSFIFGWKYFPICGGTLHLSCLLSIDHLLLSIGHRQEMSNQCLAKSHAVGHKLRRHLRLLGIRTVSRYTSPTLRTTELLGGLRPLYPASLGTTAATWFLFWHQAFSFNCENLWPCPSDQQNQTAGIETFQSLDPQGKPPPLQSHPPLK